MVEEGKLGFVGVFEITIVGTGVLDGPQKHIPENEHSSVGIGPSMTIMLLTEDAGPYIGLS